MGEEDNITTTRRARKLYASLSFAEISVYTATWVCGVMYSLYNLYIVSIDQAEEAMGFSEKGLTQPNY